MVVAPWFEVFAPWFMGTVVALIALWFGLSHSYKLCASYNPPWQSLQHWGIFYVSRNCFILGWSICAMWEKPKNEACCNYIFLDIQSLLFCLGCHNDCLDAMRIREVGKYPSCEPANKKMWAREQNCRHYFENHIPSSHFWSEHPRLKSNLSTPMRLFIWGIDFTQR